MKICIATATRAEYGLLKPLMAAIKNEPKWCLQLLVTGAHLSPEFGLTYKEIEQDGYSINKKVEMLLSADTAGSIVKSMGLGMQGYATALDELQPDFIIILGDRYEMLAVASSALIFNVPIIHIHGGEATEGAYDDAIRHAITKMSHLHFTSTETYKNRIIQMGENPAYVYNVGAIGLDNIQNLSLLSALELEQALEVRFKKYNYQVTFHPSTLDKESPEEQFKELLASITTQKDSLFFFTKANADTGGRKINQLIDDFVDHHPDQAKAFTSLGSLKFLSLVKHCQAIVGNSSSGILEAPSLKTATINIGNRQKGRLQASSVINVTVNKEEINMAFSLIKSERFKKLMNEIETPYGNGTTTSQIMSILKEISSKNFSTKPFFDRSYER